MDKTELERTRWRETTWVDPPNRVFLLLCSSAALRFCDRWRPKAAVTVEMERAQRERASEERPPKKNSWCATLTIEDDGRECELSENLSSSKHHDPSSSSLSRRSHQRDLAWP
jgi:hypothetical protein